MTIIIGVVWGGWTTAGASHRRTDDALLGTRAAICVAQFVKAPNTQARLKELKDTNPWERAAHIERGGWDKMPGEHEVFAGDAPGYNARVPRSAPASYQ
jgi:hypothetical protein